MGALSIFARLEDLSSKFMRLQARAARLDETLLCSIWGGPSRQKISRSVDATSAAIFLQRGRRMTNLLDGPDTLTRNYKGNFPTHLPAYLSSQLDPGRKIRNPNWFDDNILDGFLRFLELTFRAQCNECKYYVNFLENPAYLFFN